MKKNTLFSLFLICASITASAQCPNSPVLLTTQAQVNAFQTSFPNCHDLTVRFEVKGAGITDLTPLSGLNSSTKNFYVNFNPDLTTLSGLDNFTTIIGGDLTIEANPLLTNLQGLGGLTTANRLLKIQNNDGLLTMDGLTAGGVLTHLGSLVIIENDNLLDLGDALDNLQTIDEYILFNLNTSLPSINTMNNLTSIGWYLSLEDNDAIVTMNAFNNLTEVGTPSTNWNFEVNKHESLTTLDNFVNLSQLNHNFSISNNPLLTSISFPSLTSITNQMSIAANTSLTSLVGLGDFTLGGSLVITGNSVLPECEAQGICDFLAGPGSATISNNAPGCNSIVQVEAACALLPVELTFFNGKEQNGAVLLNWQTALEKNSSYFQVEHSQDGIHFTAIGKVASNGTSNQLHNYSFRHTSPSKGNNYYRLKEVDIDGKYAYSNIVPIETTPFFDVELYPNPTTGYVKLKGELVEGTVRLTDITGRLITEQALPDHYWLDLTREPEGMYLIEILMNNERIIKRVVKE